MIRSRRAGPTSRRRASRRASRRVSCRTFRRASRRALPARGRRELGQATLELVLLLPFVVLMALVVVQVSLVARGAVLVAHAAREGARAAAVEPDPAVAVTAAREAAVRSSTLDPTRLRVDVEVDDRDVIVTVRYADPTDLPVIGPLVGGVTLQERATMRREGP